MKLRILGFDVAYDKDSKDAVLIDRTLNEERILLTSDRELYRICVRKSGRAIMITTHGDFNALLEVFRNLGVYEIDRTRRPRCSSCNSTLEPTGRKDRWGRSTFECTNCSKLYWRGSHWKKLDALFESVNQRLAMSERKDST